MRNFFITVTVETTVVVEQITPEGGSIIIAVAKSIITYLM